MSQWVDTHSKGFPAGAAMVAYSRVVLTAGVLQLAGASDVDIGCTNEDNFAAIDTTETFPSGYTDVAVRLRTAMGTSKFIANDSITKDNPFYAAANGRVSASGSILLGTALEDATQDVVFEGLRISQASSGTAAGGTTGAAFLVDSDSTTPKIELAAQTGGTGNFKATIKPPSVITADRVKTLQNDGDANLLDDYCQTVNPAADSGTGSTIKDGSHSVDVGAVVNDANDWVVLPAIANCKIGHTIRIAANAGTNFELRTPASSNTKINDVDSDGTQEYLCTDTDMIVVTKRTTTGWVAQSLTKLGAVRTAVIPD